MLWTYVRQVQIKCGFADCDWETAFMPTLKEGKLENEAKIHLEDEHGMQLAEADRPIRLVRM